MKLNPVFDYIKSKKSFSLIDVFTHCSDKVVDTYYLKIAFSYMANEAWIKQVSAPMPEKVVIGERMVSPSNMKLDAKGVITDDEPVTEPVYGYRVYNWDKYPDFFKLGKFHKTVEFEKNLGGMKNPFITNPFGLLVDLDSAEFKKKYFERPGRMCGVNRRNKYSELNWQEMAKMVDDEIKRGLYYIAVHNYGSQRSFELRPYDSKHQWQRIVDLGVEYQQKLYECYDVLSKLSKKEKTFEMYKMMWMVDSETENMC